MSEFKIGDIVGRISYGCDVFFTIVDIRDEGEHRTVTLKGMSYRIEADAPESDLELQPEQKIIEYRNKCLQLAETIPIADIPQDMSVIAEQSGASSEEISASSEQQLSATKMISQASDELSKIAEELNNEAI